MKIFTNVAALAAATLKEGQLVETKGYYTAGDGGQARYLIKTAADYGDTPDEYGDHTLANGNVAVLQEPYSTNVKCFGLTGDGTTVENAAMVAMAAYNPEKIYFPDGTYIFHFYTNAVPLVTIQSNTKITLASNATIIPEADTALTTLNDEKGQFIFITQGTENVHVSGGTFDGNKADTVDSKAGLIKFNGCNNFSVKGVNFIDSDRWHAGIIFGDSWDGASTNRPNTNGVFSENNFERCGWCVGCNNISRNIVVSDNTFKDISLGNPTLGETVYGSETCFKGRCIRLTAYLGGQSTTADGDVGGFTITGNVIDGCSYGIETYNNDPISGRNPEHAYGVVIADNYVRALYGIGVNGWSGVSIIGNTFKYQTMTAAEITAYPGETSITDTSVAGGNTAGAGIEARPGWAIVVNGNNLDSDYPGLAGGTDYTASSSGITIGNGDKNIRCESTITGNVITKFYNGIGAKDTQHTLVANNSIRLCRKAFFSERGTSTWGHANNRLSNNDFFAQTKTLNNSQLVQIEGDWDIDGNIFNGNESDTQNVTLVMIVDPLSTHRIKNNLFINFQGMAITDGALNTTYDGNTYDAGAADGILGAIQFNRMTNKVVFIGTDTVKKAKYGLAWANAAATGEVYSIDSFIIDENTDQLNFSSNGGTVPELSINCGRRDSAPEIYADGLWEKGARYLANDPISLGYSGWICTATGQPATWDKVDSIVSSAVNVKWFNNNLQAALDYVESKGGGDVFIPAGTLSVATAVVVAPYVNLIGEGRNASNILLTDSAASIQFSDATTESRGGRSGNFNILGGVDDSNRLATLGLLIGKCSERTFADIQVKYCAGDGVHIDAAQNNTFLNFNSSNNDGVNLVFDKGCGNNRFFSFEFSNGGIGNIKFTMSSGTWPFTEPQHNKFYGGIVERSIDSVDGAYGVLHEAGRNNLFHGTNISNRGATIASPLVKVTKGSYVSNLLTFDSCNYFGETSYTTVFELTGATTLQLQGYNFVEQALVLYDVDDSVVINDLGDFRETSVGTHYTCSGTNTESITIVKERSLTSVDLASGSGANIVFAIKPDGIAQNKMQINANGVTTLGDGSSAPDLSMYRATTTAGGITVAPCLRMAGMLQLDGGAAQITVGAGLPTGTPSQPCIYFRTDGGANTSVYVYDIGSGWKGL